MREGGREGGGGEGGVREGGREGGGESTACVVSVPGLPLYSDHQDKHFISIHIGLMRTCTSL